jgi:hypothetical protein
LKLEIKMAKDYLGKDQRRQKDEEKKEDKPIKGK